MNLFSRNLSNLIILLIASAGIAQAQPVDSVAAEEQEAMELGGIVTLDYAGPADELDRASTQIGTVELSANVNVNENTLGSITFISGGDLSQIAIDQAVGAYEPAAMPCQLFFGLQYYNHGLLATHLISDPMILDLAEIHAPGAVVTHTRDKWTLGYGFNVAARDTQTSVFNNVLNCDYALNEESQIRVSSLISNENSDVDAAIAFALGAFTLDGEVFTQIAVPDSQTKSAGYLAGVAWAVRDDLSFALRNDGISGDSFKDMDMRIGLGATYNITEAIFCAFEFGHFIPAVGDPSQDLAFQVGLESSLKLPGFQRKTLARK